MLQDQRLPVVFLESEAYCARLPSIGAIRLTHIAPYASSAEATA